VHDVSQCPNLTHLVESLGGAEGLLEAVSFKKATKGMGRGSVANARREWVPDCGKLANVWGRNLAQWGCMHGQSTVTKRSPKWSWNEVAGTQHLFSFVSQTVRDKWNLLQLRSGQGLYLKAKTKTAVLCPRSASRQKPIPRGHNTAYNL